MCHQSPTLQILSAYSLMMRSQIESDFFLSNYKTFSLKGNAGIFKPRPYFWHEIRSSTHREQFGESRRPSEDI